MDSNLKATFDACGAFNAKLSDTLSGLIAANDERKSDIDSLRRDQDELKKGHDALLASSERENDLRKNEIKSLEERCQKENAARIGDVAKLDGKLDAENAARKTELGALDSFAKAENDARKTELAGLDAFAKAENDARRAEIADLDKFAKSENGARVAEIAEIGARLDKENADRTAEDENINARLDAERRDRAEAIASLEERVGAQNSDRMADLETLRLKLMKENAFLKSLASKPMSVYFDAYRTKAYDGGGEENVTFHGCTANAGGGMDAGSGVFSCPLGGVYMFVLHVATHDNKKALLSIRLNGEEVASVFDQNHKDNHKNSMAGTNVLLSLKRGDEVCVYAYTGTWLADFAMNHYTHWVGLLLKPSQDELDALLKEAEAEAEANGVNSSVAADAAAAASAN